MEAGLRKLAELSLREGKLEEAASWYRKATEYHPDKFESFYGLGRVLARGLRRPTDAIDPLRRARSLDRTSSGATLLLAECLRASGDIPGAQVELRAFLVEQNSDARDLWNLWSTIQFVDCHRSPQSTLAELREMALSESEERERYSDHMRWVLSVLIKGGPVRINCGDPEDYVSSDGTSWSHDRFLLGGHRFGLSGTSDRVYHGEIEGTDDDRLYQTHRWFAPDPSRIGGYQVPLAPGEYRVVLHFAEVWFREANQRVFSVKLEGKIVREDIDLFAEGFATAFQREFTDISVQDGILDIELVPGVEASCISAIEIYPTRSG